MAAPGGFAPPPSESKSGALLVELRGCREMGKWVGQRDLHPYCRLHRAGCCSYIMAKAGKWWLRPVARRTLPGFNGALIFLSYTAWFCGDGWWKWWREPESNRRWAAYGTAALPLGYPAGGVWRGVPVLPRGGGVLETPLRRLVPAAFSGSGNWSGQPESHRHLLLGRQGSCS